MLDAGNTTPKWKKKEINIYESRLETNASTMKKLIRFTHLFLDIGGVLLTNGWDHHARKRAATKFKINFADMENRHRIIFEIYEKGKLTLNDYLSLVVFEQKRPFTKTQFRRYMFQQSKPHYEMIELITTLKLQYKLKIAVVSNEARELNEYRIRTFKLERFVDSFISSCFVDLRKPDVEMFQLALDITQANPSEVMYIEDTPMFVQIAESLGIHSILHTDFKSTCAKLAALGLQSGPPE